MRLQVDINFNGKQDFDDMLAGLGGLIKVLMEQHCEEDKYRPTTILIPLGKITISGEEEE